MITTRPACTRPRSAGSCRPIPSATVMGPICTIGVHSDPVNGIDPSGLGDCSVGGMGAPIVGPCPGGGGGFVHFGGDGTNGGYNSAMFGVPEGCNDLNCRQKLSEWFASRNKSELLVSPNKRPQKDNTPPCDPLHRGGQALGKWVSGFGADVTRSGAVISTGGAVVATVGAVTLQPEVVVAGGVVFEGGAAVTTGGGMISAVGAFISVMSGNGKPATVRLTTQLLTSKDTFWIRANVC